FLQPPAIACNSRSAYFIGLKPVITVNKVEGPKAIEGPKPKVEHPASEIANSADPPSNMKRTKVRNREGEVTVEISVKIPTGLNAGVFSVQPLALSGETMC